MGSCKPSWVDSSQDFNNKQREKNYRGLKDNVPKMLAEVYRMHYSMHRRGAFDFPSEEEWVKGEVDLFFKNFSDEFNVIYENGKIL